MNKFSLPKRARLCSRSEIETLFKSGDSIKIYPIRCTYLHTEHSAIMVSAPKKTFKRAIDRNTLKRRMREAYRTNQDMILPLGLHLALHYTATERLSYREIEDATKKIFERLSAKFSESMDS